MKLWVDDIRPVPDESWTQATNVTEAIRLLFYAATGVKEISLDHDISIPVSVMDIQRPYPSSETFASVARYIALMKEVHPEWEPRITLHTSNPDGAQDMAGILNAVGLDTYIDRAPVARRSV